MANNFLYYRKRANEPGKAVEDSYGSIESLANKIVIRNIRNNFIVLNADDVESYTSSLAEKDRTSHEVVPGPAKQKLRFDLDITASKLLQIDTKEVNKHTSETFKRKETYDNCEDIMQLVLESMKYSIKTCFEIYWPSFDFDCEKNIVITRSFDTNNIIYSSHILISGYCVNNNKQASEFAKTVIRLIPKKMVEFIDMSIYNDTKSLRLTNHYKSRTDPRKKVIITKHTYNDSLITYTNNTILLDDIATVVERNDTVMIKDSYLAPLLEIYYESEYFDEAQTYRDFKKNEIAFDRLSSSYCHICDKVHDNDNTLILLLEKLEDDKFDISLSCRRKHGKCLSLGTFDISEYGEIQNINIIKDPQKKERMVAKIIKSAIECNDKNKIDRSTKFDLLPLKNRVEYCNNKLLPYTVCKTLCIKAGMKLGKTKELKKFIDDNYSSKLSPPVICMLSFRTTFSKEIKSRFPDFVLYSDVKGHNITENRLIIQVESLHRLTRSQIPDLLILDESESIFEQFNSMLAKEPDVAFQNLKWLLQYSKQVICMDACLGDRTYNILETCRKSFKELDDVLYHHNTIKNAKENNYYLYDKPGYWVYMIEKSLDANEHIVIVTNSVVEANTVYEYIRDKYPRKHGKIYTSDTHLSEKERDFADVNTYWKGYDYLIYTPTITAGISFEAKHYDTVFAYFTNTSCNAIVCMQMLGRVRNVSTGNYHIYYDHTPQYYPTDRQEIIEWLYDRKRALNDIQTIIGKSFVFSSVEYDEMGKIRVINEDPFLSIWVENIKINNQSRTRFIYEFIKMVGESGPRFYYMNSDLFHKETGLNPLDTEGNDIEIILDLQNEQQIFREIVKNERDDLIATANDIDINRAEELYDKINKSIDLNSIERRDLEKFWLRKTYGDFKGEITVKFVKKYNNAETKQKYKNLCQVYNKQSFNESLEKICAQQQSMLNYFIKNKTPVSSYMCNYSYTRHNIAKKIMDLCDWVDINSEQNTPEEFIYDNLSNESSFIWEHQKEIQNEFNLAPLSKKYINTLDERGYVSYLVKKLINPVLSSMYAVRAIYYMDTRSYSLKSDDLFTFDENDNSRPLIKKNGAL